MCQLSLCFNSRRSYKALQTYSHPPKLCQHTRSRHFSQCQLSQPASRYSTDDTRDLITLTLLYLTSRLQPGPDLPEPTNSEHTPPQPLPHARESRDEFLAATKGSVNKPLSPELAFATPASRTPPELAFHHQPVHPARASLSPPACAPRQSSH